MAANDQPYNTAFTALGGPCSIRLEGLARAKLEGLAASAELRLRAFEQRYSRYLGDSVVSRINQRAGSGSWTELDEEGCALVDFAFSMHEQSEGRFDITSGVLRRVWDFKSAQLPSQAEIDAVLPLIGMQHIEWQRPRLRLNQPDMQLDFGGFGKEYAADMLAGELAAQGVKHGLVELSGDIAIIGPRADGSAWPVGISNPDAPDKPVAMIQLNQGGLASSGTYQRAMHVNGVRYSHLLDASTGWPVETYAAVSVVHQSCLVAGAMASITLLRGSEEHAGESWLAEQDIDYLLVQHDGSVSGSLIQEA